MAKKSIAEFKFELGDTARDLITGFQGVITGRAQYLTGCTQYLVQPPGQKVATSSKRSTIAVATTIKDSSWIDEARLDLVKAERVVLNVAPYGGPQQHEAPKH